MMIKKVYRAKCRYKERVLVGSISFFSSFQVAFFRIINFKSRTRTAGSRVRQTSRRRLEKKVSSQGGVCTVRNYFSAELNERVRKTGKIKVKNSSR